MTTSEQAVVAAAAQARVSGVFSVRDLGLREIPRPDLDLSAIRTIDLAGNRLDAVPDWVWEAPAVHRLDLASNRITSLGTALDRLVQLEALDLSENRLTRLPEPLAGCQRLRSIEAMGNRITDVKVVGVLRSLASLDLADNRIRAVDDLVGDAPLRYLDLSANQIESLPESFARLSELRTLDLSGNLLRSDSADPSRFGPGLVSLYLNGNRLESYPSDLAARLPRLSALGNPFGLAPVAVGTGDDPVDVHIARAIIGLVEDGGAGPGPGAATAPGSEPEVRYFDQPAVQPPGLEVSGITDATRVVDLYFKRYRGLGATVRFGTGAVVNLSQVGRRRALDFVRDQASARAPIRVQLEAVRGDELANQARDFVAEAASRTRRASVVTATGETVSFHQDLPERVLNVAVAAEDGTLVGGAGALLTATAYALRVDIGPPSAESVVLDAPGFPIEALQPDLDDGWWFEVVVASSWVDVAAEAHRLFLPRQGSSWVCPCVSEHHCRPEDRQPYLLVPVLTRRTVGPVSLRCTVYQRNNAVQSVRIDATVAAEPGTDGTVVGVVDYTLSPDIGDSVDFHPRDVSVLTNDTGGVHLLSIKGGDRTITVDMDSLKAQKVLGEIREELTLISLGPDGQTDQYDPSNSKPAAAFLKDLANLAHLGSVFINSALPGLDDRQYLADLLARRSTIQVSRVTQVVFPWALVYDIPHEFGSTFTPCRLLANWDSERAGLGAYPDECPYQSEHALNTLCPYGFWGFHHMIEQPASVHDGPLCRSIPAIPGAKVALIHSLRLDQKVTDDHLKGLESLLQPHFEPDLCTDQPAVLAAFNGGPLPLIYFYCHGKTAAVGMSKMQVPYLEIGDDTLIGSGDFAAWALAKRWTNPMEWKDVPPLVFINGCHTAALSPEDVVSFVEAFAGVHAAGVVGTEISVAQPTASDFARSFYTYLIGSAAGPSLTAGEALGRARLDLLAKGNVCGLAYTPFCSMDLALTP